MTNYGTLSGISSRGGRSVRRRSAPSMARNLDGGGYGWKVDKWTQMRRFLILGSDSNTFYATARNLTKINAKALVACLQEDYKRYVDMLVEMRSGGVAPKYDTVHFALALVFVKGSDEAKAYASSRVTEILRTAQNLQEWITTLTGEKVGGVKKNWMRGWGRSVRTATSNWLSGRTVRSLSYQAIKYRARAGTSMQKVVRLSHPNPGDNEELSAVYYWIAKGEMKPGFDYQASRNTEQIWAFEQAKRVTSMSDLPDLLALIKGYSLPWEAVPNQWLNEPLILEALAYGMPIGATVRQLSRMSRVGLFESQGFKDMILERLSNPSIVAKENIHPMKLLQAYIIYGEGVGSSGKNPWVPDTDITDALEGAFYLSFDNIEPTGLNRMIAVDVSGSMDGPMALAMAYSYMTVEPGMRFQESRYKNCSGLYGVTPREAAAALALITMRTEPWYYIVGFSNTLVKLDLRPEMSLATVLRVMRGVPMGGTNISAPMVAARRDRLPVDLFEVYTDNEANLGVHPSVALSEYQSATGRNAKSAYVAMVGYNDSVADPNRSDMMDFIGFDPKTPVMLNRFATGTI